MERLRQIDKLTLFDMMKHPKLYAGLPEGLIEIPLPDKFKIKRKLLTIPGTREEYANNICYGQRLYLARKEENDYDLIFRQIGGYFYPEITGEKWVENKVLTLIKNIVTCKAKEVYPVTMRLVNLISELIINEQKLLHREPTKMELAAGIEKLDPYAELNVLDFLRDAMKVTVDEVLITPYNECLVRLMNAKAIQDYQERYMKLQSEEFELKTKKHV